MEFEFEKRDREAIARMRCLGRRIGCAIMIVTGLWSLGKIIAIIEWLLHD